MIAFQIFLVNDARILAVSDTDHQIIADDTFMVVECFITFKTRRETQMDPIATLRCEFLINDGSTLRKVGQNHRRRRIGESENGHPEVCRPRRWRQTIV